MTKLLTFVLIAFATAVPAAPRVHTIPLYQTLEWPLGGDYPNFLAEDVAIDGSSIIVLVDKSQDEDPATRVALLYSHGTARRVARRARDEEQHRRSQDSSRHRDGLGKGRQ